MQTFRCSRWTDVLLVRINIFVYPFFFFRIPLHRNAIVPTRVPRNTARHNTTSNRPVDFIIPTSDCGIYPMPPCGVGYDLHHAFQIRNICCGPQDWLTDMCGMRALGL